jgi:hypothetical protein
LCCAVEYEPEAREDRVSATTLKRAAKDGAYQTEAMEQVEHLHAADDDHENAEPKLRRRRLDVIPEKVSDHCRASVDRQLCEAPCRHEVRSLMNVSPDTRPRTMVETPVISVTESANATMVFQKK